MSHDDYDDDLEYDIEDDDIVKDGERVRVPIFAMDAVQRSIAESTWDAHKPGWRVPEHVRDQDEVVADAYAERSAWLRDAHRAPSARAAAQQPKRLRSLTDSQAAARTAYEERSAWLRDAHRGGR